MTLLVSSPAPSDVTKSNRAGTREITTQNVYVLRKRQSLSNRLDATAQESCRGGESRPAEVHRGFDHVLRLMLSRLERKSILGGMPPSAFMSSDCSQMLHLLVQLAASRVFYFHGMSGAKNEIDVSSPRNLKWIQLF